MDRHLTLEISLGDLIYAFTEELRQHISDEQLLYEVVADLLTGVTMAQGRINFSGIDAHSVSPLP
jgi:hypothetical protein